MSRPKSPERIQADIDKAIRKERRELKQKIREARRTERLRKKATHEHVMKNNGIQKIKPEMTGIGFREAIEGELHVICARCHSIIRECEMIISVCERCKYSMEVNDKKEERLEVKANALGAGTGSPLAQEIKGERRSA